MMPSAVWVAAVFRSSARMILPEAVLGKLGQDLDPARRLVGRQLCPAEDDQFFGPDLGARP